MSLSSGIAISDCQTPSNDLFTVPRTRFFVLHSLSNLGKSWQIAQIDIGFSRKLRLFWGFGRCQDFSQKVFCISRPNICVQYLLLLDMYPYTPGRVRKENRVCLACKVKKFSQKILARIFAHKRLTQSQKHLPTKSWQNAWQSVYAPTLADPISENPFPISEPILPPLSQFPHSHPLSPSSFATVMNTGVTRG